MTTLLIPVVRTELVKIDIAPDTVEVHGHRFSARTIDGMSVSISLSERASIPIIEKLATSKDDSLPPAIVGQAPPRLYGELLRGALGLPPTRRPKKWKPEPQPGSREVSTDISIRVNGSRVSARLSKTSQATDSARRVLAKLTGLGRAPS